MKQNIYRNLVKFSVLAVLMMCCNNMWAGHDYDDGRSWYGTRCGDAYPYKVVDMDGIRYSLYNNQQYTYSYKGIDVSTPNSGNYAVAAYCTKENKSDEMYIPRFVRYENVDYTVVAVGEQFFYYNIEHNVETLSIPSTVIALEAFALEGVEVPSGFMEQYENDEIEKLIIEDADNTLFCYRTSQGAYLNPHGAFYWLTGLKSVYLGRNLDYKFDNETRYFAPFCEGRYEGLEVEIGPKVTAIGESCFQNCNLTEIDFSNATSLKKIQAIAFGKNTSLREVKISNCSPDLEIQLFAFVDCIALESVSVTSNLKYFDFDAFRNCPNLKNVYFLTDKSPSFDNYSIHQKFPSDPIIYAKNQAVMNDLKNHYGNKDKVVLYPDNMMLRYTTTDNNVADGMKDCLLNTYDRGTGTMYFAQPLSAIGKEAFSDCDNLLSVTIPDKVIDIYEDAFSGCSNLRTAIIMGTLSNVKEGAFGDCEDLEEIFYLGTLSPHTVATDAINENTTIYVENTNGFYPWGTKPVKSWRSGEGDGTSAKPFEIGDYAQLMGFAIEVSLKGKGSICGKLTDDIVGNDDVLDEDGSLNDGLFDGPFKVWTPIGNADKPFCGEFDGNGHTISGLYHNYFLENSNGGLFGKLDNNAYVHHLGLVDSYMNCVYGLNGGICGDLTDGHIDNCFNASTVAYGAGIAGWCREKGRITNCHNVGHINTNGSGIVDLVVKRADAYSSVENCYALEGVSQSAINNINDAKIEKVEVKDSTTFASGEVCWLLNGASAAKCLWVQEIGVDESDEYPVFGKDTVYQGRLGNNYFYVNKDGTYDDTLDFDDSKNEDFICPVPFSANGVTYKGTLEKGKLGTIVLPFKPESGLEGLTFYELNEDTTTNNSTLVFTQAYMIEAGIPYLFKNEGVSDDFTLTGEAPISIVPETTEVGTDNFKMKGTFQSVQLDGATNTKLYCLKDSVFYHADGKLNISPFRAYIEGDGSSSVINILIEDGEEGDPTAIHGIMDKDGSVDEIEAIYDISGRKLAAPMKGQINVIRTKSGKTVKRMF